MSGSAQVEETHWDALSMHAELARLTVLRARFRIARTLQRMRSPRRIVATSLAILFFALYMLNGVFVLSARAPADPERLRLWLSGGMVIYAIYHAVRCAWAANVPELELTPAEQIWLGGAPIKRSSLALHHLASIVTSACLKTGLLAVVLARDTAHLELLIVGVLTSLVLLEIVRLIIQRIAAGMTGRARRRLRVAVSAIAAAVILQLVARIAAVTPAGAPTLAYVLTGFQSLGQTAASDTIQYLSLPWIVPAQLAVTESYQWLTAVQLIAAAASVPLAILVLVRVDGWTTAKLQRREQERLLAGQFITGERTSPRSSVASDGASAWDQLWRRLPAWAKDGVAVASRQAVSVGKYKGTVFCSFLIPFLLCVSPLLTGQVTEQWLFVVGGIALCTMLLAPPALRIDFRRDLRRMLLLQGMPVRPLSMVVGQLALPILITVAFQLSTLVVAAAVTAPGLSQIALWSGMLTALAVFTFATENALFLAFPHHEHSEGVAMMVRAKLTFLGKAAVILGALGLLGVWALVCRQLPEWAATPVLVAGAIAATWSVAVAAILVCAYCWRRFDLTLDVPPQ